MDRLLSPPDASRGALYIVRHSGDVAISYAHHLGHGDSNRVARELGDEDASFVAAKFEGLQILPEYLGTWSHHVSSGLDQDEILVHCVRYEDMLATPETTFATALSFLGLSVTPLALSTALEKCHFDRLQTWEAENDFPESPAAGRKLFRQGKAGNWQTELTPQSQSQLRADHGSVMKRLGKLRAKSHRPNVENPEDN
ncbi:MAG: sulfotransferase domain-containing protein [Candidatus Synoicihabitans palmerolidicus]|nr:sulfotransferase domain-containing protein [Candidatus Synoicihabitans palmerolidicus]